jgi:hypothetical protein
MVQVHHAAFPLASSYGTNKEIIGDLNFRRPELPADLVALGSGEDVAALHHNDLAYLDGLFCEEAAPSMVLVRFSTFGEKKLRSN